MGDHGEEWKRFCRKLVGDEDFGCLLQTCSVSGFCSVTWVLVSMFVLCSGLGWVHSTPLPCSTCTDCCAPTRPSPQLPRPLHSALLPP